MHSSFLIIVNCKDLVRTFGVKESSYLLQYLNTILKRPQQKIMQIIIKQIQGKREVCCVNMISMSMALLLSLNNIERRIKTTNAFIDDTYH